MPQPKSKAIISSSDESDSSSSESSSSSSSEDFRPAHVKSQDLQKLTASQKSSQKSSQKASQNSSQNASQESASRLTDVSQNVSQSASEKLSQKSSQKISQKSSKSESTSKSKSKSKVKPETTSASPEKRKKPDDSDDSDIENVAPKKKQKKEATVTDKTKYQVQLGSTGKKYVRYSYFKSRHYIDIRELYEDKASGELKPTKKGIMLMTDMATKALSLFDKVDEQLKKVQSGKDSDGLIPVMNNIYFKVYKFKKMILIDLRNYYDQKGEQKPGKGIAMTEKQYEALKDEEANIRAVIDDCY